MTNLDAETVGRLRALLEKATPGPWRVHEITDSAERAAPHRTVRGECNDPVAALARRTFPESHQRAREEANAALIVEAINALPALLDAASRAIEAEANALNAVATWAISHSLPTGHGDTLVSMLDEMGATLNGREERLCSEVDRLRAWVNDLQSGMYVNCVYCGHRYGPGETTPVTMANALKAHVESCPKHPMSALKARAEAAEQRVRELEEGLRRIVTAYNDFNKWVSLGFPARTLVPEPDKNAVRNAFARAAALLADKEGK